MIGVSIAFVALVVFVNVCDHYLGEKRPSYDFEPPSGGPPPHAISTPPPAASGTGSSQFDAGSERQKAMEEEAARQEEAARRKASDERWGAISAAKEFVKQQLSHPSTASFPWTGYDAKLMDADLWLVSGTVKAKNSFNLEVNLRFSCLVKHVGDNWQLFKCEVVE